MKGLFLAFRRFEDGLTAVAAAAVFFVMSLGVAEIAGRSVFNAPIQGHTDLVIVAMPVIVFLGISQCLRKDSHIQMSLIIDMLPYRAAAAVKSIGCLISSVTILCISIGAYRNFERALTFNDNTADLRLITWPFKLIVAGSLLLLAIRFAVFAIGYTREAFAMKTEADGNLLPEAHDELDLETVRDD
ncbi:TRAP transporter small permease [Hoeflea prorocentri]|uniref:TRAP transporter small permease protein n=1 Tax=Hoeflea prorocentri TaxID=1922333 RepID=A0A9X3UDH2_9HYPH|nr:TRAP transporter small permease [Hoeflea prorocentri]MCY6379397.1 TRAP transporter small permease [Hoeflea prorocentri]MDA5397198.1 TRAP transporter small permease [Hoeflea prorocentri]